MRNGETLEARHVERAQRAEMQAEAAQVALTLRGDQSKLLERGSWCEARCPDAAEAEAALGYVAAPGDTSG